MRDSFQCRRLASCSPPTASRVCDESRTHVLRPQSPAKMSKPTLKCDPLCSFGDRLYFTTFNSPVPTPRYLNSLSPQSGFVPRVRPNPREPPETALDGSDYYWFSIDDSFVYLSFYQDWGPLNLAMVYKFCIYVHELLEDEAIAHKRLVLYSSSDPRRKANAALLMALYVLIVRHAMPWEAFQPIAELEFMPFRDAGRGPSDFNLTIQDCLWGFYKAKQNGLCDMNEFDVDEYEYYEKVENGDWNWITPNFVAFASPVDTNWIKREKERESGVHGSRSSTDNLALQRKLPTPFMNCLEYFEKNNVQLVIRLNTHLYDKTHFTDRNVRHMELYFDDGTNPTDEIVRTFLDSVDPIVSAGGAIAIHCKAGLGRTGTLIGAYLVWKYGFTASEAIAFMRIVRPGCVVGPQQHFMYFKQLEWTKWALRDEMRRAEAETAGTTRAVDTPVEAEAHLLPIPQAPVTPPAEPEDEMEDQQATPILATTGLPPVTPSRHVAAATQRAQQITPPGQPRKTPIAKRAVESDDEDENDVLPALDLTTAKVRAKRPSTRSTTAAARAAGVAASEARPTRVTRSTAGAANIRRTGNSATATTGAAPPSSPVKGGVRGVPSKVPRLAPGTSVRSTAAKSTGGTTKPPTPPSPVPSRLPTLTPGAKRPTHNATKSIATVTATADSKPKKAGAKVTTTAASKPADDAWMKNNSSAVVVPATKSARPGLRPIRRRRSSFSAADVVA